MELQAALDGRWEEWTIYLHPAQRYLAERRQSGQARITGSAGIGKTVVALHRTAHLVRAHPARVLLTSFSRTLASRLEEKLTLLVPDERQRQKVTVMNLYRWANLQARAWDPPYQPMPDEELTAILGRAARAAGSELPLAFLRAEWQAVIEPRGLRNWDAYRVSPWERGKARLSGPSSRHCRLSWSLGVGPPACPYAARPPVRMLERWVLGTLPPVCSGGPQGWLRQCA
ncbi:UvrD-helicase domain-containing protein [Deinococcus hopiensis]|uniref:UvrD-helicase domain-containing protein n=1 Tax=Deinococcus hopiensis TaxID=309885 RepID=UPI0009FFCDE2|nr:UvrD-helicase domain-containing protein [Deinococcus hopiensis]